MIIDTSALVAILRDEAEAEMCARAIESAVERGISAVNFVQGRLSGFWQKQRTFGQAEFRRLFRLRAGKDNRGIAAVHWE